MDTKKRKISTAGILGIVFVLVVVALCFIYQYQRYFNGNRTKSDVIILDSKPEASKNAGSENSTESTVTQPPVPSSPDSTSTTPSFPATTNDNTSNFNDTESSSSPQSSNYQNVTQGNFDER